MHDTDYALLAAFAAGFLAGCWCVSVLVFPVLVVHDVWKHWKTHPSWRKAP